MSETTIESKPQAFQLKGSLFTFTVLQIIDRDIQSFKRQLDELITQAPKFFYNAPIVIDIHNFESSDEPIDFQALHEELRAHGLIPVGVRGGNPTQHEAAQRAGLAIMAASKTEDSEAQAAVKEKSKAETKDTAPEPTPRRTTKLITTLVRSGQQIYARNADLIVVASVSEGAEILSDGHIHVYGTLRGRALAGVTGDTSARIFCQNMQAELLSIASRYVVSDSLLKHTNQGPMQIFLDSGRLTIKAL